MSKSKRKRKAPPLPIAAASETAALRICASESIEIQAAADAGDGKKKLPSFTMVAYTGVPMKLEGFYHPVVIDLATASAPNQRVPVPIAHNPERIAGHTEKIDISPQRIKASGVLSADNEHSANVSKMAANNFPWQASVGASPSLGSKEPYTFVPRGEKALVNGRSWDGPLYVAKNAIIREISLLPMGADNNTSAAIAAQAGTGEISMDFSQWLTARNFDPAKITAQERAVLQAAFDAEQKIPKPSPAPATTPPTPEIKAGPPAGTPTIEAEIQARRVAEAAEVGRVIAIRRHCAADPGLETEVEVNGVKTKVNLQEHAILAGWSAQEVELVVLRAGRTKPIVPGGLGYAPSAPEINDRVLEAAVLQAGHYNFADVNSSDRRERSRAVQERAIYTDQVLQAAHTAFRGRIGLQQLLVAGARANGYQGSEVIRDDIDLAGVLRAAFRPEIRADGASYASIANIVANVQNKYLLQGYNSVEAVWRMICGIKPVKDFKPTKSVALLGDFMYSQVGPDGELKNAKISDQAFANQAYTYGRIHTITRQNIINDDLGALTAVPMKLGRGAGLKLNDVFWALFLNPGNADDSVAFWSTSHTKPNYFTGAATNLQSSSLATALQQFRDQVDPDGFPLGINVDQGCVLLVPTPLEQTAWELTRSDLIVYGGTNKTPNTNVWKNKFTPAVSSYLANTNYTGNSTTAWYLISDPVQGFPVIEVCFLNGNEEPVVQTAQAEFDTLGISMRGFYDFGVSMQNFRGAQKSKGAA